MMQRHMQTLRLEWHPLPMLLVEKPPPELINTKGCFGIGTQPKEQPFWSLRPGRQVSIKFEYALHTRTSTTASNRLRAWIGSRTNHENSSRQKECSGQQS